MTKKYLETSSNKIVKGIFKSGTTIIISYLLTFISLSSTSTTEIGHYISISLLIVSNIIRFIAYFYILKFICSIIQKILKAIEK